jgi:hypothetical protein
MMTRQSDLAEGDEPVFRRQGPSRKSIIALFAVGSLMLVIPLAVVLGSVQLCRSDTTTCFRSEPVRVIFTAFPYVMIGGGVLVGYNMKRVSDSITYDPKRDAADEEDGDNTVPG